MERHWNVLKFTCGLMVDSSVLIERICQAFVEIATRPKQRESIGSLYGSLYLTDIEREKSAKSLSPFVNAQLCYNRLGHIPTNSEVHLNYRLFYLNGWDRSINHSEQITERDLEQHRTYKELSKSENSTPCSVVIHQGLRAPLEYFLKLCSCISQPIKCLLVFGEDEPRFDYFTARPLSSSTGVAVGPTAGSKLVRRIPVPVGPIAGSEPARQIPVPVGSIARSEPVRQMPELVEPLPGNIRACHMTTETYEPTPTIKNLSESAILSFKWGLNPFNAATFEHLATVVLHKVNCQYLAKSLNECKQLIHLTYIKCRSPSFETLGNNEGLAEITVEDCTLGANGKAELFAQLKYLTKLEKISFRGMKCEHNLAKLIEEGVLSSLELLKSISLQRCMLTTPTAVALMESLVQCPLVEIDLSDNFLIGFIKELHETSDVSFRHLEKMNCNNSDLLKTDTMALARLISENRFPEIKTIFMKGNIVANDKAVSEELEKSCEHFRSRKGHRVQVYMDRKNEIRKRNSNDEVRHDDKKDKMKDIDEKDEVRHDGKKDKMKDIEKDQLKDHGKKDEVHSSVEENETKTGNCHMM